MNLLRETIRNILSESVDESVDSIKGFIASPECKMEGTWGNSFNPLIGYEVSFGDECPVYFKLEPWGGNTIYINSVTIANPDDPSHYDEACEGKGHATRAMEALLDHADRNDTTLILEPQAFNHSGEGKRRPNDDVLEGWYSRLGFEWSRQDNDTMEYTP